MPTPETLQIDWTAILAALLKAGPAVGHAARIILPYAQTFLQTAPVGTPLHAALAAAVGILTLLALIPEA